MPYYMNVFTEEFRTELLMLPGLTYSLLPSPNKPDLLAATKGEPYDLSVANLFAMRFSFDGGRSWARIFVELTAASGRTAHEIAAELNEDAAFSGVFEAFAAPNGQNLGSHLRIKKSGKSFMKFKSYVLNTADPSRPWASAESVLQFNGRASVGVLPTVFDKYTVEEKIADPDGKPEPRFIKIDPALEGYVLTVRGLELGYPSDYELLRGESEKFTFRKTTTESDVSDRILEEIEYAAGATVGALGRRTIYVYDNGNDSSNPNAYFQIPWVLRAEDIIYPPAEVTMTGAMHISGIASVSTS